LTHTNLLILIGGYILVLMGGTGLDRQCMIFYYLLGMAKRKLVENGPDRGRKKNY
jgi:hypothetical protein